MGTTTKTLYDIDFAEWSSQTAELLRAGRIDEVDLANVAEEIESLGKRDRWAVHSQMLRRCCTRLDGGFSRSGARSRSTSCSRSSI
jgi:hypothetical protein